MFDTGFERDVSNINKLADTEDKINKKEYMIFLKDLNHVISTKTSQFFYKISDLYFHTLDKSYK